MGYGFSSSECLSFLQQHFVIAQAYFEACQPSRASSEDQRATQAKRSDQRRIEARRDERPKFIKVRYFDYLIYVGFESRLT